MGMYFRKSFGFGPLRFNLSKSGVGASVGVPGFRVGVNAKGQSYVHAGAGGVYYRSSLQQTQGRPQAQSEPIRPIVSPGGRTHGPVLSHGSAHHSGQGDELTEALSRAHAHVSYQPISIAFLVAMVGLLIYVVVNGSADFQTLALVLLLIVGLVIGWGACVIAWQRDQRERVSLKYDLDGEAAAQWNNFTKLISSLQSSSVKLLRGAAEVYNSKYHSGAGRLVDTGSISVHRGFRFSSVECNISTPAIEPISGIKYVFLPDRMIVVRSGRLSRIDYSDLQISTGSTNIIEERAPAGSTVVGHTWRYTNKDGGPDRRFNNNYQLPIVAYSLVRLSTHGGMDHAILFVSQSTATSFVQAIPALSSLQSVYSRVERPTPMVDVSEPQRNLPVYPSASATSSDNTSDESEEGTDDPFDAALDAICCVMFADGKCSTSERKVAIDILSRMKCPLTPLQIQEHMSEKWKVVQRDGFDRLLQDTQEKLSSIRTERQHVILKKCLQDVAKADGEVAKNEKVVYRRLLDSLPSTADTRN